MLTPNTAWAPQWMDTSQGFQQHQNWLTHGWWEPESLRWFTFSLQTTAKKSHERAQGRQRDLWVNNKSQTRSSKPHTQTNMCIDPQWLRQSSVSLKFNPQFPAATHLSQTRFLSVRSTRSAESFIGFFKLIRICFLSFRIKTLRNEWPISLIFPVKLNTCSVCVTQQRGWFGKHCGQANQHFSRHSNSTCSVYMRPYSRCWVQLKEAFFWIYFVQ